MIIEKEEYYRKVLEEAMMSPEKRKSAIEVIGEVLPGEVIDLADAVAKNITPEEFNAVLSIFEEAFAGDSERREGIPSMLHWIYEELIVSEFGNGRKLAKIIEERIRKVILMIDDSANCTEAVELLKECGVPFEISPSSSEDLLPYARYKGELYCGLPDIRLLLEGLGFGDKAKARWDRMNAEAPA